MAQDEATSKKITLGRYLATIRKDRGLTLRQVEEATNKEVSNAYLSQIENDKIQRPSPNILHALATLYSVGYDSLMERAGHITLTRNAEERHGRLPTFADVNLTPEEEAELLRYLNFIRTDKNTL